jgi:hypothetical protein
MTPRYPSVPEHWKHPEGPYRQAPEEYGAEWWLVNPFASPTPWLTQSKPTEESPLPEGFLELFGPRPRGEQFRVTPNPVQYFRLALAKWEQDLKYFQRTGVPEWATEEAIEAATQVFESWEMGRPRFYEGRYGWSVRFRDSQLPEFEAAARAAVETSHLVVAQYQMALLDEGRQPSRRHPFVPPHTWSNDTGQFEEDINGTD